MITDFAVLRSRYYDSVYLMRVARRIADAEGVPVVPRVVVANARAQRRVQAHDRRRSRASTTARRSSGVMPTEHGKDNPLA